MATGTLWALYTDPARPLTVAVGPDFGLVSMPAALGTAALAKLRARRVRLGPVLADERRAVMRIGFLLAPEGGPDGCGLEGHGPDGHGLREWAARSGAELRVRVGGHGTTATLPPLVPAACGWLRWVVPPSAGRGGVWTPAGELLAALTSGGGVACRLAAPLTPDDGRRSTD